MQKFCAASLAGAVLIIAGSAAAADLGPMPAYSTPAPAFSWSGPYAGLFAGYGWSRPDASEPFNADSGFFYNFGNKPYSLNADGFFGGGTLGYNWQPGALVIGLEGEVGYLGLEGSRIDPNGIAIGTPDTKTTFQSDFYSALTGRLGLAMNNVLIYAKGGGALLDAKATTIDPCVAPPTGCGIGKLSMSGDKTMTGWTVGGGLEWGFAPRWTTKAEYAYYDFGTLETTGSSSFSEHERQSIDVTAQTVRMGLNYRWGAP